MKIFILFLFAIATVLAGGPTNNALQEIQGDTELSSLLGAAGGFPDIVDLLGDGAATLTVFAPVNTGFDQVADLNSTLGIYPELMNTLLFHVINGSAVESSDLSDNQILNDATLFPGRIRIRKYETPFNDVVTINQAVLQTPDIQVDNGVIHKISQVIYPPPGNVAEIASSLPSEFSTLVAAVGAASTGVQNALNQDGITVFAPTNDAFDDVLAFLNITLPDLVGNQALLDHILSYHVLSSVVFSAALPASLENVQTVAGTSYTIDISVSGATVTIESQQGEDATVSIPDVVATNGVIHVINKVLVPNPLPPTTPPPTTTPAPTTTAASANTLFFSFGVTVFALVLSKLF